MQFSNQFKRINSLTLILLFLAAALFATTSYTYASASIDSLQNNNPPDPVLEHLSKVRNISLEESTKRIEWQDRASELNSHLEKYLPTQNGGVWIGASDDRVKVGLVRKFDGTANYKTALDNEVAKTNLDGVVDFIPVEYSFSELKETKDWISLHVRQINSPNGWGIRTGIRTDLNKVVVGIPEEEGLLSNSQKDLITTFKNKFGHMIKIETYRQIPQAGACIVAYCDSPLRGGVGLHGSNNYNERWCTLGFIVQGNSGQRYALTAGHCQYADGGNGWATRNTNITHKPIGPVHRNELYETSVDAMIVRISSEYNWSTRGWIYMRAGIGLGNDSNGDPISGPSRNESYGITGTSVSGGLINERVCMSGSTLGSSCGAVKEVDVGVITSYVDSIGTVHYVYVIDLVRADLCGKDGDSGAPVIRSGKALGIFSSWNKDYGDCSDHHWYTGIRPIIRAMDDTINVVTE